MILGLATPRFALVLVAIFTDRISAAVHHNTWLAFAGWLFLPMTELAYVIVTWWAGGVHGFGWFLVALGFLADLSTYTGSWRGRKKLSLRA
jgi:hypothetical protein